jgi:SpoVK/Ycf46/Vps4 family AAA+-type ATPase
VDVGAIVAASDGFTPADIEFAARRASQSALETAVDGGATGVASGPATADYLAAVKATRATVSDQVAAEFEEDIATLARL